MTLAIVVFIVVMLTVLGFSHFATRSMHKRDVDQIKDRLAGKTRGTKALKQTQLIKADAPERPKLADRILGMDLQAKLRDYIEQGGLADRKSVV